MVTTALESLRSASKGQWKLTNTVGRIEQLSTKLGQESTPGGIGIGHTRWATHGVPNEKNAHPHHGGQSVVTIVHNGVIENYALLKQRLIGEGFDFESDTDSEVIAHLIASCLNRLEPHETQGDDASGVIVTVVKQALGQLRGTYGLVILFRDHPDLMIAARLGSPLVVGVGDGEHFVASDASPMVGYTDKIVYLADHQVEVITADALQVTHRDQGQIAHDVHVLDIETGDVDLNGYDHYMLKEICEQPESLRNAMRGRLSHEDATAVFGGLNLTPQQLHGAERIILTACGTSWHAALVGEYLIEDMARIPVEV